MFRLMQDFCLQSLNPYTIYQVFTYVGQLTWSILRSLIKFRKLSISFGFFHDNLHFSRYLSVLIIRRTLRSGLCRTSTSLPSWISIFLILVPRLLIFISDICLINTKAMVHSLWMKTRTPEMTFTTELRDSKIRDGEDVDVLEGSVEDIVIGN